MFGKNLYLSVAIFMFFIIVVIFFQNAAYGGSFIVFLFDSAGTVPQYIFPITLVAGVMGACITLYIQKLMEDMDVDQQSGGLNI